MATHPRQNRRVPLRFSRCILVISLGCLAYATGSAEPRITFPNACRDSQTDQIRTLWQALEGHPTAGAYNTVGALYAAADRVDCAIPSFKSALQLDRHNWESWIARMPKPSFALPFKKNPIRQLPTSHSALYSKVRICRLQRKQS
jgi:hypothetical protein